MKAARNCVKTWGGDKNRIQTVIAHSVSGWDVPGMAYHIMYDLDLPVDTRAIPVVMAGCHAGLTVTSAGKAYVESEGGLALVCTGDEFASQTRFYGNNNEINRSLQIPGLLFGDGFAAMLLGRPTKEDIERTYTIYAC